MPAPSKGLIQAYELRDLTSQAAKDYAQSLKGPDGRMMIDKDSANGLAALVRAWDSSDERVRIHRGKPLPGSLRPSGKPTRRSSNSAPSPIETPQSVVSSAPADQSSQPDSLPPVQPPIDQPVAGQ